MDLQHPSAIPLGLLDDTWLELRCGQRLTISPVKLLRGRYGARATLVDPPASPV